ncbi:MAG: 3'-5' exonuclease [Alistipes sp.]|jgi:DNA polymerase-3 subunit epsilon|nr:3'-5' exonuclease [Alistipes sp.]
MKNFAAIDFETANSHRTSVCSVGIVVVRDGAIREKFYELIRPAPNFYSHWNTQIHGLSASDTAIADLFPEVWQRIAPRIADLPLVAHNSPFDEGCLRATLLHYALPAPAYTFHCTCRASRRAFPGLPNHKLPTVAAHVGFDFRNHHHALADAEACAVIAMAIIK